MKLALLVLAAALVAPAAAGADTISFVRDENVWLMAPDGSHQRQVTQGRAFEWPSAADDGTLLALSGDYLYRLTPRGETIGAPIPAFSTQTSDDFPIEPPTHVRLSPDGTKIAYDAALDDEVSTLWTPADSTTVNFPGQTEGQEGLGSPSWIGNGTLLLSRDQTADPDDPTMFARYTVGGGDNTAADSFSDTDAAWASGFDAAASHDGTRVAVLEDDAATNDGAPTRVQLRLFNAGEFRCQLAVTPSEDYNRASPTFSPDGARLAWAEPDGIHVARSDCTDEHVVTLPGAWEPYWSPADDSVPAPAGPVKLTLKLTAKAHPRRATLFTRGIKVQLTVSAPATVRITLRWHGHVFAAETRKLADAGTSTVRVKPRASLRSHRHLHLTLRATAAGAAPVSLKLSPR